MPFKGATIDDSSACGKLGIKTTVGPDSLLIGKEGPR
jgi:hypothetical protein